MNEWIAYDKLDPIGFERLDHLAAMLAQVIFNTSFGARKGMELKDFLPQWGGKAKQTPRQIWGFLKALAKRKKPDDG